MDEIPENASGKALSRVSGLETFPNKGSYRGFGTGFIECYTGLSRVLGPYDVFHQILRKATECVGQTNSRLQSRQSLLKDESHVL